MNEFHPDRLYMCGAQDNEGAWMEVKDGETPKCFWGDCDCTPVVYVRADVAYPQAEMENAA